MQELPTQQVVQVTILLPWKIVLVVQVAQTMVVEAASQIAMRAFFMMSSLKNAKPDTCAMDTADGEENSASQQEHPLSCADASDYVGEPRCRDPDRQKDAYGVHDQRSISCWAESL